MKVAIMQPYLFPYIGYFQLITSCDVFVFLDNVQYIERGWVNRNYILSNDRAVLFSIPLMKSSRNEWIKHKKISTTEYLKLLTKFNRTIHTSYSNCINYKKVEYLIKQVMNKNECYISSLAENSVTMICDYLNIDKNIFHASDLITDQESLKYSGAERIARLVNVLGGTEYINTIGGNELYDREWFLSKGIKLSFLTPEIKPYPQNSKEFIPSLSIIDVLMNNDITHIQDMSYSRTMLAG